MRRSEVWIGAVLTLLVVVGVLVYLNPGPSGEGADTVVHFGAMTVPIADRDPIPGKPDIYQGVATAKPPEFDTGPLGPDLTFVTGTPDRADLDELDPDGLLFGLTGIAVYLGDDSNGDPAYLFQQHRPSLLDMLRDRFTDQELTSTFGSSYDCCRQIGARSAIHPQPHIGTTDSDGMTYITAGMYAVPASVSVVAFSDDKGAIGWQRPISGYVGIAVTSPSDSIFYQPDIWITAYSFDGEVIEEASWPPVETR